MKRERERLAVVDRTMTATKPAIAATFWRLDALSKSLLLDHLTPQQSLRFLHWAEENADRIRRVREAEIAEELRATAAEDEARLGSIEVEGVPGSAGVGSSKGVASGAGNGQGGDFMDVHDDGDNGGGDDDDVAMGEGGSSSGGVRYSASNSAASARGRSRRTKIAQAGAALARQLLRMPVQEMRMEAPQKLLESMHLKGRV